MRPAKVENILKTVKEEAEDLPQATRLHKDTETFYRWQKPVRFVPATPQPDSAQI